MSQLGFRGGGLGWRAIILADAFALYPDGQKAGLIFWAGKAGSFCWECMMSIPTRVTGFRSLGI